MSLAWHIVLLAIYLVYLHRVVSEVTEDPSICQVELADEITCHAIPDNIGHHVDAMIKVTALR